MQLVMKCVLVRDRVRACVDVFSVNVCFQITTLAGAQSPRDLRGSHLPRQRQPVIKRPQSARGNNRKPPSPQSLTVNRPPPLIIVLTSVRFNKPLLTGEQRQ